MQFGKGSEKLREKTARQAGESEKRIGALQEEMAEVPGEQHDPLPRETRTLSPTETTYPACGGEFSPPGCDVSEQLELSSSAFKVI